MIGGKPNVLYEKAYAFGVQVVRAYQFLSREKQEYVLSKQLLRCGTSIGANIAEANGALSDADFSAKISINYKECLETKYWLHLLHDTEYLTALMFESLYHDADELSKMLFATLRSTNRVKTTKNLPDTC
ncbi:four helix bundle protein [Hymenobacter coccineus]|uniref:Four helix bundle protein n=1 Tax=Hymenobacter coccineus TaxID=1908235 RepID=A0A1G1SVC5_9BACT|nr:four helix bundle protein [Hymenobacter coccineus]OGX82556.1 four helix bundle protein [Hymenobacter coccineus]